MGILINLVLSAVAVLISAYLIPGVVVMTPFTAVAVAVLLGLVNAIIKPVLLLLTLPINLLTLGLFTFVINALMVLLVAAIVPGFVVPGFLAALLFSLVLSLVGGFLHVLG